jgi:hypothetical protein
LTANEPDWRVLHSAASIANRLELLWDGVLWPRQVSPLLHKKASLLITFQVYRETQGAVFSP